MSPRTITCDADPNGLDVHVTYSVRITTDGKALAALWVEYAGYDGVGSDAQFQPNDDGYDSTPITLPMGGDTWSAQLDRASLRATVGHTGQHWELTAEECIEQAND